MTQYVGGQYIGDEDIIGDEELVGYGDDPDVARLLAMGADAAHISGPGRKVQTVSARQGLWKRHYLPLNLSSGTTVAAAGTGVLQNNPQRLFKPSRLVIPSDVAGLFSVLNIFIGVKPQLVATGGMPARLFSEQSFDSGFEGDTAQISQAVSVQVQNNSLGTSPIQGAMRGLTVM
jgi:hypothetical protein